MFLYTKLVIEQNNFISFDFNLHFDDNDPNISVKWNIKNKTSTDYFTFSELLTSITPSYLACLSEVLT